MKRDLLFFIGGVLLLFSLYTSTFAQDTKVSGVTYADYYWFADSHDEDYKDKHGFWFRRIYLTVDHKISDAFSSRLRFEMNQPGDLSADAEKQKMNSIVKDAYLKWKTGGHQLIIGMSGTPTWGLVEKVWGYRSVERTLLDIHGFGSSRDIGFAAKGKIDSEGKFKYHAMIGNGASNSSEINKGKKFLASLGYNPTKAISLEVYGDFSDNAGESDQYTIQGFLAYTTKSFRAGLQYFHQNHTIPGDDPDETYAGISLFGSGELSEQWSAFARIDRLFDPSLKGRKISYLPIADGHKSILVILGVDFHPVKDVKIMPNIEMVFYDKEPNIVKPASDIIPRITFSYAL